MHYERPLQQWILVGNTRYIDMLDLINLCLVGIFCSLRHKLNNSNRNDFLKLFLGLGCRGH